MAKKKDAGDIIKEAMGTEKNPIGGSQFNVKELIRWLNKVFPDAAKTIKPPRKK